MPTCVRSKKYEKAYMSSWNTAGSFRLGWKTPLKLQGFTWREWALASGPQTCNKYPLPRWPAVQCHPNPIDATLGLAPPRGFKMGLFGVEISLTNANHHCPPPLNHPAPTKQMSKMRPAESDRETGKKFTDNTKTPSPWQKTKTEGNFCIIRQMENDGFGHSQKNK